MTRNRPTGFSVIGAFLVTAGLCGVAFAGSGSGIPCGSAPGFVNEFSSNAANFTVNITGADGKVLQPQPAGFPFNAAGVALAGGGFGARVAIPAFNFACDAKNRTIPLPKVNRTNPTGITTDGSLPDNGGEESDLALESLFFDNLSQTYSLQDLFGTIAQSVGYNVVVAVPDLYADTNDDGSLDSGDVLYSLVDMSVYLNNIPTFTEGEAFNVVNGTVAGLPGMLFSTTDFTFNPSSGFTGTNYTGEADVESEHDLQATPEPAAIVLAGLGLLSVVLLRRYRAVSQLGFGCKPVHAPAIKSASIRNPAFISL